MVTGTDTIPGGGDGHGNSGSGSGGNSGGSKPLGGLIGIITSLIPRLFGGGGSIPNLPPAGGGGGSWKTVDFWISLLSPFLAWLASSNLFPEGSQGQSILVAVLALLSALGYQSVRAMKDVATDKLNMQREQMHLSLEKERLSLAREALKSDDFVGALRQELSL